MPKRNARMVAFIACVATLAASSKAMAQDTAAPSAPQSHRMPVIQRFSYSCDGRNKVVVFLRDRNAQVNFKGKAYAMKPVVVTESGTRYSDGTMVWWSKGGEGFLQDESKPGQPVRLADNCKLDQRPAAAKSTVVSGMVAYRERMAMPANAVLTMQLQDVSLADAPATVIAEQRFTFAGHQVPLPFELSYDAAKIDQKRSYALSARITVDGQLMFMNTTAMRVITQGNPVKVDLMLQMVEGQNNGPK